MKRGKDPLLTDQSEDKSEQKDLPVCKSLTWIAKLSIMGSCLCVDAKSGEDLLLPEASVDESDKTNVPLFHYTCKDPIGGQKKHLNTK